MVLASAFTSVLTVSHRKWFCVLYELFLWFVCQLLRSETSEPEPRLFCLSSEPNSFEKKAGIRVDGEQLGRDFTHLRQLMSEFKLYHNAELYGPDVGQLRDHGVDVLNG